MVIHCRLLSFILLFLLSLTACAISPPDPCDPRFVFIAPTPTRPADPTLADPPQLISATDDGTVYCPPVIVPTAAPIDPDAAFTATDVVNLSLDSADQQLLASAHGDDMQAIAWLSDGQLVVALSRGGGHFQQRVVDTATSADLAFSDANRLHLVYESDGTLYYRAADQGQHPAEAEREPITTGSHPHIVLDQFQYAHVVFTQAGSLHHAAQKQRDRWQIGRIAGVSDAPSMLSFAKFGEDLTLGYLIGAAGVGGSIQIFRWQTTPYGLFPSWNTVSTWDTPAGESLLGSVQLHHLAESNHAVAAWVTEKQLVSAAAPHYQQPFFSPANPLYPDQIGHPDRLHSGLNAATVHNDPLRPAPFRAGLMQTVSATGGALQLTAFGRIEGTDPYLRIGIDPSGGSNADADGIIWSDSVSPTSFASLSISAGDVGAQATVFLEATHALTNTATVAVWDSVSVTGGTLVNGDFEAPFAADGTPEGWSTFHSDDANRAPQAQLHSIVYVARSADGGHTWDMPVAAVENRSASGTLTGRIAPAAFPIFMTGDAPPDLSLVYLYEAGDPPLGSHFERFGRPHLTRCTWSLTTCTDTPGTALLADDVVRPTTQLQLSHDPLDPQRHTLIWATRQTDLRTHDIAATTLLRR